jgi:hypothetical protein
MSKFSLRTFVYSSAVITVGAFSSFYAAFSNASGNGKHDFLSRLFEIPLEIFSFPIVAAFGWVIEYAGFVLYFILLFINCLFYGLIIERLFSLSKKKPKIPPVPNKL